MIPAVKQHSGWGFVCGRICVLEGRLVTKDFFMTLLAQERLEDFVPHLQDTLLNEYISPGSPWDDFNAITDRCFFDYVVGLRENCPTTMPTDFFLLQGDYLNAKNALVGLRDYPFQPGLVPLEKIAGIATGDISGLPDPMYTTVASLMTGSGESDPALVDIAMDGTYLRHVLEMAESAGIPLITETACERILARAVVALWRATKLGMSMKTYQQYFLPLGEYTPLLQELMASPNIEMWPALIGGSVGDMMNSALEFPEEEQAAQFELLVANHLARVAKDGQMQTAGPERVFSFIIALYGEIQNLKLVVCGRMSRVDTELLRRRLRECYA